MIMACKEEALSLQKCVEVKREERGRGVREVTRKTISSECLAGLGKIVGENRIVDTSGVNNTAESLSVRGKIT